LSGTIGALRGINSVRRGIGGALRLAIEKTSAVGYNKHKDLMV
jgi:hypothetical protein